MKVICRKQSEHVAEIILNRPERRNAVDFDVINDLKMHLQELRQDRNLSVLIIRGEGDVFCSGGDLQSFHSLLTREDALTMLRPMGEVLKEIVTFPAITVAYLNGSAVGGGAEIASAVDYRFAKGIGVVGFIQGNLHITTGWGGASLLKRRIGLEKALMMLGTTNRFSMKEAIELGFVADVTSLEDLYRWTEKWVKGVIVQTYKDLLLTRGEKEDLFLAMDKEVEACASLWETREHHDAVRAFLNKK
ncbi:enoyl-CoA hydratase/carnithine racemase [Evansella vedderi]|uniref:Enoyl-CoA hydratase/carnithine racemase n=1 Tax=Evansella vedderi TaxID=38282 RepID=A0ABT9ZRG6_9BACI|nr:enoyl-CoA hydratase/isomerase family protein [Evansella vedderi]MDQ0253832.1 enoyl-CoA hydratase/carnithine racemase [Evansella vedderi]